MVLRGSEGCVEGRTQRAKQKFNNGEQRVKPCRSRVERRSTMYMTMPTMGVVTMPIRLWDYQRPPRARAQKQGRTAETQTCP